MTKEKAPSIDEETMKIEEHQITYNGYKLTLVDTPGLEGNVHGDRQMLRSLERRINEMYVVSLPSP